MNTSSYMTAFRPEAQAGRGHQEAGQQDMNTHDSTHAWIHETPAVIIPGKSLVRLGLIAVRRTLYTQNLETGNVIGWLGVMRPLCLDSRHRTALYYLSLNNKRGRLGGSRQEVALEVVVQEIQDQAA